MNFTSLFSGFGNGVPCLMYQRVAEAFLQWGTA